MNPDKAILTSMMVTLGSTTAASMVPDTYGGKGELPAPRLLIGTALAFFGLSILADLAPKLAIPLAASIAVTAVTYYGFPVASNWIGENNLTPVGTTKGLAE